MLEFIGIYTKKGEESKRASSLSIDENGTLKVVGVLEHGSEIEPLTGDDARMLAVWLVNWIANNGELATPVENRIRHARLRKQGL